MTEKREYRLLSKEEKDLVDQSTKKVKGGEHIFSAKSSLPISYAHLVEEPKMATKGGSKKLYKDSVLGIDEGISLASDPKENMKNGLMLKVVMGWRGRLMKMR